MAPAKEGSKEVTADGGRDSRADGLFDVLAAMADGGGGTGSSWSKVAVGFILLELDHTTCSNAATR